MKSISSLHVHRNPLCFLLYRLEAFIFQPDQTHKKDRTKNQRASEIGVIWVDIENDASDDGSRYAPQADERIAQAHGRTLSDGGTFRCERVNGRAQEGDRAGEDAGGQ